MLNSWVGIIDCTGAYHHYQPLSATVVSAEHFCMEQGHCDACRRKWQLTDTDLCPCGETLTISHIVESCPLTKLNGGLSWLHSADEDAVSWLTSCGSWHTYEKKKKTIIVRIFSSAPILVKDIGAYWCYGTTSPAVAKRLYNCVCRWNLEMGCSWSLEMVPLESLGAISHSIATMAVSYDMIRL